MCEERLRLGEETSLWEGTELVGRDKALEERSVLSRA